MLRAAKQLLDLCTERFPSPRSSQSHNLTIKEGFLVLTLMQGDTYLSFNLSEVDLERTPESLLDELATLVKQAAEEEARRLAEKPTSPDGAA